MRKRADRLPCSVTAIDISGIYVKLPYFGYGIDKGEKGRHTQSTRITITTTTTSS
jgi:hypothetical protein